MTTSQKAALSLLISVLLFGGFTALTYTGLFDLIEARFYNPSITSSLTNTISRNAEAIDNYLVDLQTQFSGTMKDHAIKRSFLPDQRSEDIFERSRVYGLLLESVSGLQWIRFIDSGGLRIHFSTYGPDILQQDRNSISYHNYNGSPFPYEKIAVAANAAPKFSFDEEADRIIFSFPFYDSFEVYRGTAIFSLSVRAITDKLINEGRIKAGQDISIISNPQGFLSGMSTTIEKALAAEVASLWREGDFKLPRLTSPDSNTSLALISVKTSQGFFVGRLVNEDVFSFPQTMKIILLASFFVTVYLSIFLLFNIRQDSVTIVQNRLKQLQISLIEQYYERKGDVDWSRWSRELEQRRDEIGDQLKRGIAVRGHKKSDIDALVDKSWDELISVIGGRKDTTLDEEKLQIILNRILAALPGTTSPVPISPQSGSGKVEPLEELEDVEAVEEVTAEAEPLEDLEEIEEVEAVEEVTAEAEPLEELEEIEEVEAVEEITAEEIPVVEIIPLETEAEEETVEELDELVEFPEPEETKSIETPDAEVPIIDIATMNLSADLIEEVVQVFDAKEEVLELEELGSLEDDKKSEKEQAPPADEQPGSRGVDLDNLASQIEFSPIIEQETQEDDPLHDDFEIVSPFATLLFDFSSGSGEVVRSSFSEEESPEESNDPIEEIEFLTPIEDEGSNDSQNESKDASLEEDKNTNYGLSVMYKPFYEVSGHKDFEMLEGGEETIKKKPGNVIEEREGIHYVSKDVLNTAPGSDSLNRDFKDLVDSIIK